MAAAFASCLARSLSVSKTDGSFDNIPAKSMILDVANTPRNLISASASMVNKMSCIPDLSESSQQQLTADAAIEVVIDVPFVFQAIIPVQVIESTGTQVLQQLLDTVLPRFLEQLVEDYRAWASGDNSRQPLGTGKI